MIDSQWWPWGWGKEDRAFWQVDPADPHTLGPHCRPQVQIPEVSEGHGFALTWPYFPRGHRGWAAPPWSKASGILGADGVSPAGDSLLFLSSHLLTILGAPEDKGIGVCVCAWGGGTCVHMCVWWQDGQEDASKSLSWLGLP